jgi:hypothetical protein
VDYVVPTGLQQLADRGSRARLGVDHQSQLPEYLGLRHGFAPFSILPTEANFPETPSLNSVVRHTRAVSAVKPAAFCVTDVTGNLRY